MIKKINLIFKGFKRRMLIQGFYFSLKEAFQYVTFYNNLLVKNEYELSLKRRLSHLSFYCRVVYLFPNITSNNLFKIVPRSLTHSVYEKNKIDRKKLTYDKVEMYKILWNNEVKIPLTFVLNESFKMEQLFSSTLLDAKQFESKIIEKPRFSNGGNGIKFVEIENLNFNDHVFYQENLKNHIEINKFQGNDYCSTLRYVFYNALKPVPIGASFQFNTGKVIDHMMKGGSLSVLVDTEKGLLIENAYDYKGNCYELHPISNVKFHNFQLPNWQHVKDQINKISEIYKSLPIIAVDICIRETDSVVLEVNAGCGTIAGQLNKGWLDHQFFQEFYPKR